MAYKKFSTLEQEIIDFDFQGLEDQVQRAKANIAKATTAADVKTEICEVWRKVRKYIKALGNIPVIGKYVDIFCDLMDALCPS